ncbi:MAG: type IV secretion system DNA-binding domain-containing protein [Candidatus Yonathbacteria bacterium]|nr:type IV secretion system DNA-binding domain-containing protein [Candidatus Yonathbacteria bacterium]
MYLYDKNRITYFAETDRRNKRIPFGIKAEDRTRHMYIIGKTGMGKSTCIENMVVQDIKNGEGFAFIDPHGKSAALLLDYIPEDRVKDVVYFAPFDTDNPISFNVMEDVGPDKRHLVANGLMSAFKKIWGPETFSARMEYILMNALLALLEYPDSTLLGVSRMLTDKAYRKKIVDNVKDPSVRAYWVDEFAKYSENYAKEAVPGIQNKLGQFTSNPLIRNIIGQPKSSFDLRKMMDERKILIVNLSKGQLGEGNAALLGGMIITKIYLAAMSRADLTEGELKKLPNFYMYVDEFQNFANESFADILSEARKYKLALTVAHQYIKQMDEKVADAVFGNVGTQIMFRVGAPDAEVLEKEYAPVFTAEDMVSLGLTQIYLKLMIDGVASHPFSAVTIGPIAPPVKSLREEVFAASRTTYGHPREKIEREIAEWFAGASEAQAPERTPSAPRTDRQPRSGAHAERPRQKFTSQNLSGQAFRSEKVEKPFARAFKDLPKQESKEDIFKPKLAFQTVELSALAQPQSGNRSGAFAPTRGKRPSAGNLVGLKAALADIVEAENKPAPTPIVPVPVQNLAQNTQPIPAVQPKIVPEEKKAEAPARPLEQKKEIQKEIPQEEKREEPNIIKEVPEDVLTAILRGDD